MRTDQSGLTGCTSEPGGHYHNGSWFTDKECRCVLTKPKRERPLSRAEKARALVECGECETLSEARAFLADMGE
jgi:hypothetical protein